MIEAAYWYGLTPEVVASSTAEELASFIAQRKKRRSDDREFMAKLAYISGCLGSMSLLKDRPSFDTLFPEFSHKDTMTDVERSKAQMLAYAEYLNREARRRNKDAGNDGSG